MDPFLTGDWRDTSEEGNTTVGLTATVPDLVAVPGNDDNTTPDIASAYVVLVPPDAASLSNMDNRAAG
jgi:hypothetical protein